MKRVSMIMAIALIFLVPTAALCDLTSYYQDFELLGQADPAALTNEGWLVFGNVFAPNGAYLYGYGPFPAPNGGEGFSAIDFDQGGACQGDQQLSVYSDYANGDHGNGNLIEANVFQEQVIGFDDVDSTWVFEFDYKAGNIAGATTAKAFIKTLDPNFQLSSFVTADMTAVPDSWGNTVVSLYIDESLEGHLLQFGFLSTATFYEGSGIFYDNLKFTNLVDLALCVEDECDDEGDDGDDEGSNADGLTMDYVDHAGQKNGNGPETIQDLNAGQQTGEAPTANAEENDRDGTRNNVGRKGSRRIR